MEVVFQFYPSAVLRPWKPHLFSVQIPKVAGNSQNTPLRSRPCIPVRGLISLSAPAPASTVLPEKPPKFPTIDVAAADKIVFLESLGVEPYRQILSVPLSDLKSTVDFLLSLGFSSPEIRRISGMCPEVLAFRASDLAAVVTFLRREAGVGTVRDLRRAINRRPRLLVSPVATRLRPTLYFLQMLGIPRIPTHTHLLSCSVEEKLIPRIEFLEKSGFSAKEARAMLRRFPQLFCYGVEGNLRPKLVFLVEEMGRGLEEARDFPHYFSFSLKDRIRPRHRLCEEKKVVLSLPAMLRPDDEEFKARLEVCVCSSPPSRYSPLWREGLECAGENEKEREILGRIDALR